MYIVDETYFIREINIPNLTAMNSVELEELELYIDEYSRQLLSNCLGLDLFTDLDGDIENGVLKNGAQQKWIDLVEGKTYTIDGVNYNWQGLIYNEGTYKGSILADFVYYHWLENQTQRATAVGQVVANVKNATSVGSTQPLVNAWNRFVSKYQNIGMTNLCNRYLHNGVIVHDWYGQKRNEYVTLLQFLKDNEATYPDAKCDIYSLKNQLGL